MNPWLMTLALAAGLSVFAYTALQRLLARLAPEQRLDRRSGADGGSRFVRESGRPAAQQHTRGEPQCESARHGWGAPTTEKETSTIPLAIGSMPAARRRAATSDMLGGQYPPAR